MCANCRGHTLLELLIAVSITAAVFLAAAVSAKEGRSLAVRRRAQQFAARLQAIGLLALQTQEDLEVELRPDGYRLSKRSSPAETLAAESFPSNLRLAPLSAERSVLRFFSSGIASPASLRLSDNACACTITISLRGRISVQC